MILTSSLTQSETSDVSHRQYHPGAGAAIALIGSMLAFYVETLIGVLLIRDHVRSMGFNIRGMGVLLIYVNPIGLRFRFM